MNDAKSTESARVVELMPAPRPAKVPLHKGPDIAERWFRMKYYDDLSDIRPEVHGYYKYYVHHFVTEFFTREKVSGKNIFDFGCGPGFYSAILAGLGARVTGIDLSPFLIGKTNEHKARRQLSNVEFISGDFLAWARSNDQCRFDYVIAIDTVVSLDYCRDKHNHDTAVKIFRNIAKILKGDGRFYIIESHPCFGRAFLAVQNGQGYCVMAPHYKIEYKNKDDEHHFFTLAEMTRALNESDLAVLRVYEPDPSPVLAQVDPQTYQFRLEYPGMIVYEIARKS